MTEKPLIAGPCTAPFANDIEQYPDGIIIPIDKPYRWTSADVIRKIKYAAKRHFGKKNLKVGHAGTLDPLATGVLLVCIGKATKMAETLQAHDKEYIAGVSFGATTPSYDLEKEIDRFFPHEHISRERIESVLPGFIGEQEQVAPLFSAKSVDGVRAYELARKLFREQQEKHGEKPSESVFDSAAEDVIRTSHITISRLELLSFGYGATAGHCFTDEEGASTRINVTDNSGLALPTAELRVECSKGTYIRALARDLGEALDSGAHLSSLIRSRSGDFRIEEALSIEQAMSLFS